MPAESEQATASDTRPFNSLLLQSLRDMSAQHIAHLGIPSDTARWMTPLDTCLHQADEADPAAGLLFELGSPTRPESKQPAGAGDTDAGQARRPDLTPPRTSLLEEYEVNEHSEILAEMDFDELSLFDFDTDRHRGILLHSILGSIRHTSDLRKALARHARRYRLTKAQTDFCRATLDKAFADPRVQQWFDPAARVANERPIAGGEHLRRPDRVVWLPDGSIAVVDYKFGTDNRPSYLRQVRRYTDMLAAAGHPGAKGYLWFPLKGEIIEVNPH